MKHWAITVGINHYQRFQPLSFAERDAQAMHNFLVKEAGFAPDHCLLLTDTSPPIWGKPTYPTRENIQSWIERLSQQYLQPGDMLWYFFSGYGVCYQGADYLMPIEGEPLAIAQTGIPMATVYHCLKSLPTETLLVLLDINRSQGMVSQELVGVETKQLASHAKIPTILSCKPEQFSREAAALGHGFFTTALLESLRTEQSTTIDSLNRYLQNRLPELSEHHWRPTQQPVIISPAEKVHQVLLPTVKAVSPLWSSHQETIALSSPYSKSHRLSHPWAQDTPPRVNGVASQQKPVESDWGDRDTNPLNPTIASTDGIGTTPSIPMVQPLRAPISTRTPQQNVASVRNSPGNCSNPVTTVPQARTATNRPPQQPPIPTSELPATDSEPEDAFWRRMLLWGCMSAFLLFLSVLLKNWSVLFPSSPPTVATESIAANPANAPEIKTSGDLNSNAQSPQSAVNHLSNQVKSGDINAKSTRKPPVGGNHLVAQAAATTPPAPSMLAIARAKIKSELATPYQNAIQTAQKIPSDNPEYQQAQQEIAIWSGEIWAIAQRRVNQGELGAAIWAVSLMPQNQPTFQQARPKLGEWCRRLKNRPQLNGLPEARARQICQRLT
jgi:hypothetical protein